MHVFKSMTTLCKLIHNIYLVAKKLRNQHRKCVVKQRIYNVFINVDNVKVKYKKCIMSCDT